MLVRTDLDRRLKSAEQTQRRAQMLEGAVIGSYRVINVQFIEHLRTGQRRELASAHELLDMASAAQANGLAFAVPRASSGPLDVTRYTTFLVAGFGDLDMEAN
jgi:hypothetical protein